MPENHRGIIPLRVTWGRLAVAVLLSALLSWVPSRALSQAAIERIDVLGSGIYELEIIGRAKSHGASQARNTIAKVRLARATRSISLQRCVSFGFEYVIVGAPPEAHIPVRMVTRFPEPGLRDSGTGQLLQTAETTIVRVIGRRHYRAYTLEHEWELVPGTWILEIWHGSRKLTEQSFTLVAPCKGDCGASPHAKPCGDEAISARQSWRVSLPAPNALVFQN